LTRGASSPPPDARNSVRGKRNFKLEEISAAVALAIRPLTAAAAQCNILSIKQFRERATSELPCLFTRPGGAGIVAAGDGDYHAPVAGGVWMGSRWGEIGGSRAYVAVPKSGSGPGLLIFSGEPVPSALTALADLYAEEGYVAVALGANASGAAAAIKRLPEISGKIGAVGFGAGGKAAIEAAASGAAQCAVVYYGAGIAGLVDKAGKNGHPVVFHLADSDADLFNTLRPRFPEIEVFYYRGIKPGFAEAGASFDKSSSNLSYTRTLELLRRVLGPRYDLEKIWDRHTELEFATRAAEETMTTMVAEPYVNHVPVMTGGTGFDQTLQFYKNHFIPTAPKDSALVPISRTVGADRVADEMLFCFTHDVEIDWMLPGIKPTGKYVQIPLVAIVRFRGDKIHSEHIYWDQASVLVQIGVLDAKLYPTAGVETAKKAFDENLPSNTLMARWKDNKKKATAT
jgi:carboxymethylenebutenolidase